MASARDSVGSVRTKYAVKSGSGTSVKDMQTRQARDESLRAMIKF